MKFWEMKYNGFESLSDLDRDVSEALDCPEAKHIPMEFQGTIIVTMEYIPHPSEVTDGQKNL